MRLFVAITLEDACRDALNDAISRLRERSVRGNFTRRENLHLTLAFLGEVDDPAAASACLGAGKTAPFLLEGAALGRFRREDGDIVWAGVKPTDPLMSLQRSLARRLRGAGFALDDRRYTPHITLGRRVVLRDTGDFDRLAAAPPRFKMEVTALSLMSSQRTNGRLSYREIRRAHFNK